jgi:hypothetical protein
MADKKSNTKTKKPNKTQKQNKKSNKHQAIPKNKPLVDFAENIEIGVKSVGKKMSDAAAVVVEKTSTMAKPTYDKLKESFADVSELGKEMLDELTNTAQHYLEKYKNRIEMKKLNDEKNKLVHQLGNIIYVRYKIKNVGPIKLFRDPDIQTLIKDIENKNKEIVKMGKKIDKS